MKKNLIKIVTINGGNGGFSLLKGLREFDFDLSAIVAMTDDGGSTGKLRRELGVLPPGDIRYCLSALSTLPQSWEEVLNYRFERGALQGHAIGNILIAALEKFHGDFLTALREMEKILAVKGKIIPVTFDNVELRAKLKNGKVIRGQHHINIYQNLQKDGVGKLAVYPRAKANPKAVSAIKDAQIISIGPGNIYCSILPILIFKEIREAILKSKAVVVFNCNLINRKDQTEGFDLDDYVKLINQHLGGERIDVVTVNKTIPQKIKGFLKLGKDDVVKYNSKKFPKRKYKVLKFDLLDKQCSSFSASDAISYLRSPLRHDGKKVGKAIVEIYKKWRR